MSQNDKIKNWIE